MTNAEKIRSMSDEELRDWLWWWTLKNLAGFLQHGGAGCMDAVELKEWLTSPVEEPA